MSDEELMDEITEPPTWQQAFTAGLGDDWREDPNMHYSQCANCDRPVWAGREDFKVGPWSHYPMPQFTYAKMQCHDPAPVVDAIIGRPVLEKPEGIFQKKDVRPESDQMMLFMLSERDRSLFGVMVKRLHKKRVFTEGEQALLKRMRISMNSNYVMNDGGEVSDDDSADRADTDGTQKRKVEASQRRVDQETDNAAKDKNPEGVPTDDKGYKP